MAGSPRPSKGFEPALDQAKWAPATRTAIQKLIDNYGTHSPEYDPGKRPYAIFDWDNTAIINDTEEALFAYQIDHLTFKLTPAEFAGTITMNVPPGAFRDTYKNTQGQVVTLEAILLDLNRDYQYLYTNYQGFTGTRTLEEVRNTEYFTDFKTKLLFLYDAINETHGAQVGYPWVLYFFVNMTVQEVQQLAEASNDLNLGAALSKIELTSPETLPGAAGVVEASHVTGIRTTPEIADAMDTLRANGIDIYVVTASMEDVVRVFASHPKYGYHVPPEHVIGMRLAVERGLIQPAYRENWPLIVYHGKTEAIQSEIARQRGYGPLLVAGDSSGDYEMMTEFPDTQLVLLVNRLKGGNIGKLCARAVAEMGQASPRHVLQGRNENTGLWVPTESTMKLGETQYALLP